MRTLDAQFWIALTERWGGLVVDEVLQVWRLVLGVVWSQLEVVFMASDSRLALAMDAVAVDAVADFVDLQKNLFVTLLKSKMI